MKSGEVRIFDRNIGQKEHGNGIDPIRVLSSVPQEYFV